MALPNASDLHRQLRQTVGPTPWYWQTFPAFTLASGERFAWTHHGEEGPLGYLVSLGSEGDSDHAVLALNTYCRPFLIGETRLGTWCPQRRAIRLACFEPGQMKPFDLGELAGWFKPSSERIYAATPPVAELEIPLSLAAGTHPIEVPAEFGEVDEVIVPTSYKALEKSDPAYALYVVYPRAGLVEVLPQRWFTTAEFEAGKNWIPRAARDSDSHRLFGECFGIGTFLLQEDGMSLGKWLDAD